MDAQSRRVGTAPLPAARGAPRPLSGVQPAGPGRTPRRRPGAARHRPLPARRRPGSRLTVCHLHSSAYREEAEACSPPPPPGGGGGGGGGKRLRPAGAGALEPSAGLPRRGSAHPPLPSRAPPPLGEPAGAVRAGSAERGGSAARRCCGSAGPAAPPGTGSGRRRHRALRAAASRRSPLPAGGAGM